MKIANMILAIGLFAGSNALAQTTLNSTDLMVEVNPSVKQLKVAQEILSEAIAALEAQDTETYLIKIQKVKKYIARGEKKVTFDAAFIAKVGSRKINYFADLSSDIRYDVQVENTCFNGTTKEALSLLKAILLTGFLNYDEEWYANPKIQGQNILIDMVDGPNDITETLQILPCK